MSRERFLEYSTLYNLTLHKINIQEYKRSKSQPLLANSDHPKMFSLEERRKGKLWGRGGDRNIILDEMLIFQGRPYTTLFLIFQSQNEILE